MDLLGTGDMGIGNTTPSSAIIAAFSGIVSVSPEAYFASVFAIDVFFLAADSGTVLWHGVIAFVFPAAAC